MPRGYNGRMKRSGDPRLLRGLLSHRVLVLSNTLALAASRYYPRRFGVRLAEWRVIDALHAGRGISANQISQWLLTDKAWVFLLLANLLMLFVGCFLETTAAILILVPILMPIVLKLGIDPVHFGLIMVLNLMIGLLHPPLGMVLFVLARVSKLSVERTTIAIIPWLIPLLISLILITYIPSITLWLPRQFF